MASKKQRSVSTKRFSPVSIATLTSWPASGTKYADLSGSLKDAVDQYYVYCSMRDGADVDGAEEALRAASDETRDAAALRLRRIHAALAYQVFCIVFWAYIKKRSKSSAPESDAVTACSGAEIARRELAWSVLESVVCSDALDSGDPRVKLVDYYDWRLADCDERKRIFLTRDIADAAAKGAVSAFLRASWFATVVLGREPHPRSVARPLTETEWGLLTRAHGITDLPGGERVTPALDYGALFAKGDARHPSFDWRFLIDSSRPFVRHLSVPEAFLAFRASRLSDASEHRASSRHSFLSLAGVAAFDAARGSSDASAFAADIVDYALINASRPDIELPDGWRDAPGIMSHTVMKYIDAFRRDFMDTLARVRREVSTAAALDPAGMDAKVAKGRLPDELERVATMIRNVVEEAWTSTAWGRGVASWLASKGKDATPQEFLKTPLRPGDAAFTRYMASVDFDRPALQTALMLFLSAQRSQVWRDSLISEFVHHGKDGYVLKMTRPFKTSSVKGGSELPSMSRWKLGEVESCVVHVLLATHPAGGADSRFFVTTDGAPVTQRHIAADFARLGRVHLGIPSFGAHVMRTFWMGRAVDMGISPESIASFAQVSRSTMLKHYAAASGPGQAAGDAVKASVIGTGGGASASKAASAARPNGKALRAARDLYKQEILRTVDAIGGCAKDAFGTLLGWRTAGALDANGANWFDFEKTFFGDGDAALFVKYVKNVRESA